LTDSTTGTHGSNKFTDDSLTIGDLCTADDRIYAIVPSKPSLELPLGIAVSYPEFLTEALFDKTANSKQILISTIETLTKERHEHAMEKLGQDERMEEIMTRVKGMIDEERAKADEKLARGLKEERAKAAFELKEEQAKADEKLAKANKRIDELQFKLQEVDEVSMETVEWISNGVCPGSYQHLLELTVTGRSLTGSNQAAKPAQHRAGKTCLIV
jgi:hypothetical protein